ncbi:unnamed protein product [Prunus brigantina]
MASVNPVDPEIGEGFAPFSISSNTGPDTIHLSPFQSNKNNKGLGPPRARSSSVPPPEASIEGGFAMDPISRAGHVDSTPPGTKTHGLLSAAMKKTNKGDIHCPHYVIYKVHYCSLSFTWCLQERYSCAWTNILNNYLPACLVYLYSWFYKFFLLLLVCACCVLVDWIGLDNSLDSRYVEGRNGGHLPNLVQVGYLKPSLSFTTSSNCFGISSLYYKASAEISSGDGALIVTGTGSSPSASLSTASLSWALALLPEV